MRQNTAFCYAAASGSVGIVQDMKGINSDLPTIAGNFNLKPILMAALLGHTHVVECLLDDIYFDQLTPTDRIDLLITTINNDLYDVALKILAKNENLANARNDDGETALYVLAQKAPTQSDSYLTTWRRLGNILLSFNYWKEQEDPKKHELLEKLWSIILERFENEIPNIVSSPQPNLLFVAIEKGNYEFVATSLYYHPDLLFEIDDKERTLFHVAVENRQEKIFSYIYELDGISHLLTSYKHPNNGNNILHYAAILPSQELLNKLSGAALQMQRELFWFKVVEDVVRREYADMKNSEGLTPKAMFSHTHKDLRKQGEKWMRETSNSCMLVATLVAAGVLQAVYQKPTNENETLFLVFLISSSISLVTSTSSTLTFLAILTSTYKEEDFLVRLPLKLMLGLFSLSIAIITMLVAFTATISIIDDHTWLWISVAILACISCIPYILRQLRLLVDVYRSTFRSGYHFHPHHKLFHRNSD